VTQFTDRAARFVRLAVHGGKHTTLTAGVANQVHTCDDKCVSVRLFNYGTADVFITFNGAAATTGAGWPILAKGDTGFFDCVGGVDINYISGSAAQRVEVLEILDQ
jgi:hypothetical protein